MGSTPPLHELHDPTTGRSLLVPRAPIPPPAPPPDAPRIAIIDSGILGDHPQLTTLVHSEKAFRGTSPRDTLGHGTYVALLAVHSLDMGVDDLSAPAQAYPAILSARVTNNSGEISLESVIAAIRWAVRNDASFVNLSLGFTGSASEFRNLCGVIERNPKVLFVAAAGNLGPDTKVYPASCDANNLLAVSEMGPNLNLTTASGLGDTAVRLPTAPLLERWEYHLDLGMSFADLGNTSKAIEHFSTSIGEKRNADALWQLARLDIQSSNYESALNHLEEARAIAPGIAGIVADMGTVHFLQGLYPQAETLFRHALRIDNKHRISLFNLGQTLLALDRLSDALPVFHQLRNLDSSYPGLNEAIQAAQTRAQPH